MPTRGLGRFLVVVLLVGFVLLALSLAWHLVGMDHGTDMGMLGACVTVLAAGLVILIAGEAPSAAWVLGSAGAVAPPAELRVPIRRSRPPPHEGTVLRH